MVDPSGWEKVNITEVIGSALISVGVGMIRLMMFIRLKRQVRFIDVLLEPSLAVLGGMVMWAIAEAAGAPDVIQSVVTSLGAWGGPHTLNRLEQKYLGERVIWTPENGNKDS